MGDSNADLLSFDKIIFSRIYGMPNVLSDLEKETDSDVNPVEVSTLIGLPVIRGNFPYHESGGMPLVMPQQYDKHGDNLFKDAFAVDEGNSRHVLRWRCNKSLAQKSNGNNKSDTLAALARLHGDRLDEHQHALNTIQPEYPWLGKMKKARAESQLVKYVEVRSLLQVRNLRYWRGVQIKEDKRRAVLPGPRDTDSLARHLAGRCSAWSD